MECDKCGMPVRWLVEVDGVEVGFCCVPEWLWQAYPGWKEREDLSERRAEQARRIQPHLSKKAAA